MAPSMSKAFCLLAAAPLVTACPTVMGCKNNSDAWIYTDCNGDGHKDQICLSGGNGGYNLAVQFTYDVDGQAGCLKEDDAGNEVTDVPGSTDFETPGMTWVGNGTAAQNAAPSVIPAGWTECNGFDMLPLQRIPLTDGSMDNPDTVIPGLTCTTYVRDGVNQHALSGSFTCSVGAATGGLCETNAHCATAGDTCVDTACTAPAAGSGNSDATRGASVALALLTVGLFLVGRS